MKKLNNIANPTNVTTTIAVILAKAGIVSAEASGWESVSQQGEDSKYLANVNPTGKAYLGNAFSLQMVADNAIVCKVEVSAREVPSDAISCIGHADTAKVVGSLLNREVAVNRVSIALTDNDVLYVAQIVGGRLPEGAITIPEGMDIKFYRITVRT